MERKIKSQSGETLAETLVAMLVIVLAVMMLAGGIVTAARINKSARDLKTSFNTESAIPVAGVKIRVRHASDSSVDHVAVKAYQTNDANNYFYYEEVNP